MSIAVGNLVEYQDKIWIVDSIGFTEVMCWLKPWQAPASPQTTIAEISQVKLAASNRTPNEPLTVLDRVRLRLAGVFCVNGKPACLLLKSEEDDCDQELVNDIRQLENERDDLRSACDHYRTAMEKALGR